VVVRGTSCTNLATVLLLTLLQEMVTSQYFNEWTTLAAPFSSTLIFNTARPQEDFKELLEDEAFQRPCGTLSFSLKHTHTHISHSLKHTHTHTHTSDEALQRPCGTLTHSLTQALTHTHTHLRQGLAAPLQFRTLHTHSLTQTHTHTLTHTHTHTSLKGLEPLSHTLESRHSVLS